MLKTLTWFDVSKCLNYVISGKCLHDNRMLNTFDVEQCVINMLYERHVRNRISEHVKGYMQYAMLERDMISVTNIWRNMTMSNLYTDVNLYRLSP